ncbi:MAG: hypothetical protein IJJ33_04940 [Victivallales bacterium]|nr:hypothetical protein [Victivallales bacterium]
MTVRQIAISLFLLAALGARGATSIRLLKEGDWRKHSGLAVDADGNGALSEGRAETLNAFPMDKSRSYRLSGEFRLAGNANEKARLYFGVEPLDARNRVIQRYHVSPVPGKAMAELAAPLRRNDLFAIVRGAHGWTAKRTYRLALHAKQDKGDLPNFDVTPSFVPNGLEELPDGTVKVTFANPCQVTADAGTAARLHQDGDTYIYAAANRRKPSGEWQTFSGMFSLKGSGMGGCAVHPGTASVKVVFFLTGAIRKRNWSFVRFSWRNARRRGFRYPKSPSIPTGIAVLLRLFRVNCPSPTARHCFTWNNWILSNAVWSAMPDSP